MTGFLRYRFLQVSVLGMLLTWGWVWDFVTRQGSFWRFGRMKAFFLGVACVVTHRIWKLWDGYTALFVFYLMGMYVYQGLPGHSGLDLLLILGTLFMVPVIYDLVPLRVFENTVLMTGTLHGVTGIVNAFGIYPFVEINNPVYTVAGRRNLPVGFMAQETLLAPFLVFAFGIALYRMLEERRLRYAVLSILFLAVTVLTGSTMGAVSLVGCLLVFALFYGGMWAFTGGFVLLLSAGLLVNHFFPALSHLSGRMEPWKDAWNLFTQRPVFGYGLGSWSVLAQQIREIRHQALPWTQVHNEPLQMTLELGIVGMLPVLAFHLKILGRVQALYWFRQKEMVPYVAGIAVFLGNALGNYPLHVTPLGQLFAFCLFVVLKSLDSLPLNHAGAPTT